MNPAKNCYQNEADLLVEVKSKTHAFEKEADLGKT